MYWDICHSPFPVRTAISGYVDTSTQKIATIVPIAGNPFVRVSRVESRNLPPNPGRPRIFVSPIFLSLSHVCRWAIHAKNRKENGRKKDKLGGRTLAPRSFRVFGVFRGFARTASPYVSIYKHCCSSRVPRIIPGSGSDLTADFADGRG